MGVLTNTNFTKVFKTDKTGDGRDGEWILYDCYVDAPGWERTKLAFFETVGKSTVIPEKGMAAQVVEYKQTVKGKFTNYTITKIVPVEGTTTPQPKARPKEEHTPQPARSNGRIEEKPSFYISYAKDIAVALIEKEMDLNRLPEICEMVVSAGLGMLDGIIFDTGRAKQEPTPDDPPEGTPMQPDTDEPEWVK